MEIENILKQQKDFFKTHKTKDVNFRLKQLKNLRKAILDYEDKIYDALYKDLKKSKYNSYLNEIGIVLKEISYAINNLKKWSKDKKVNSGIFFLSKNFIKSEPLGQILVISPWNYPFNLAICPVIGAISAGNTIILKPSEISTHTAKVIEEMITKYFDEKYFKVILGDSKKTSKLLDFNFDYIFFTGSENIGKIVMQKAANNLTPLTLELGGKSPCIIDKDIDLDKTASRIINGKFMNAGQTCVAPDYLLVHSKIKDKLIKKLIEKIDFFYSKDIKNSNDYERIINEKHFNRLINYLKDVNIVYGGKNDIKDLFISPTLIDMKNIDDINNNKIMKEEIFGPILPIMEYNNLDEAIEFINSKPKPLALYIFSNNKKVQEKVLNETSSGGSCINDTIIHLTNLKLPFGGVGQSGFGAYHGKSSFNTFSHKKSILKNTNFFDIIMRFPPHKDSGIKILNKLMK